MPSKLKLGSGGHHIRKKLVIVGDGGCGKTCLLSVFSKDEFPTLYLPTVFDTYVADIEVSNNTLKFKRWMGTFINSFGEH